MFTSSPNFFGGSSEKFWRASGEQKKGFPFFRCEATENRYKTVNFSNFFLKPSNFWKKGTPKIFRLGRFWESPRSKWGSKNILDWYCSFHRIIKCNKITIFTFKPIQRTSCGFVPGLVLVICNDFQRIVEFIINHLNKVKNVLWIINQKITKATINEFFKDLFFYCLAKKRNQKKFLRTSYKVKRNFSNKITLLWINIPDK